MAQGNISAEPRLQILNLGETFQLGVICRIPAAPNDFDGIVLGEINSSGPSRGRKELIFRGDRNPSVVPVVLSNTREKVLCLTGKLFVPHGRLELCPLKTKIQQVNANESN